MSKNSWITMFVPLLVLVMGCSGPSDSGSGGAKDTPPPTIPPAAAGATGNASIAGTVRYEGAVPNLPPVRMDADPGCAKKHTDPVMPELLVLGEDNAMANVLVYVKGGLAAGVYPAPSEPVVLDQRGCRYNPHVVSVQTGQPFQILNSDELLHNVHGLPKANTPFNQAMPAAVKEAKYSFNKEEIFKIKCDVHPWMGAWVGVFAHPFHGVTRTDGAFSIEGLPAGTYDVEAVHERLGKLTAQVTVGDAEMGSHDFVFTKN